ncbi:MAG: hypothetical protein WCH57_10825 [Verrucomicrobiota bacterium]
MKKTVIWFLIVAAMAGFACLIVQVTPKWEGVDDTVVGKYAKEAGRPPQKAYIDTDRGDLLLFFFLIAGISGGFLGGYCFRELFPPEKKEEASPKILT